MHDTQQGLDCASGQYQPTLEFNINATRARIPVGHSVLSCYYSFWADEPAPPLTAPQLFRGAQVEQDYIYIP